VEVVALDMEDVRLLEVSAAVLITGAHPDGDSIHSFSEASIPKAEGESHGRWALLPIQDWSESENQ